MGPKQDRHVAAPELLLVDGEGLPAVADGGERLRDDVVAGKDQVVVSAVGLGGEEPVDDVADAGRRGRVGMGAEVVEDGLGLLARVHRQLEELGLDAGGLERLDLGIGAVAAGGVARLLVADHDAALDAHRDRRWAVSMPAARSSEPVRKRKMSFGSRTCMPAGGAAALPKAMPASLARAATSV